MWFEVKDVVNYVDMNGVDLTLEWILIGEMAMVRGHGEMKDVSVGWEKHGFLVPNHLSQ